jgi:hypothetical protein
MKFSLISVTLMGDDGRVSGYWVQNHIGTLETAQQRARDTEATNSNKITICIVDEVNTTVPMGMFFEGLKKLG